MIRCFHPTVFPHLWRDKWTALSGPLSDMAEGAFTGEYLGTPPPPPAHQADSPATADESEIPLVSTPSGVVTSLAIVYLVIYDSG